MNAPINLSIPNLFITPTLAYRYDHNILYCKLLSFFLKLSLGVITIPVIYKLNLHPESLPENDRYRCEHQNFIGFRLSQLSFIRK